MGVLDELVIYSKVNEDFTLLSAPVVNCPIRPSQGALEAVTEYAKFVEQYNAKLKATKAPADDSKADVGEFAEQLTYYKALKPRMQARLDELTMRDTTVAEAQAKLEVKEAEYNEQKKALGKEAKQTRALQREIGDIKTELANAKRAAEAPYAPEFRALGGLRGYFSGHYNRDLPRYTSSLSGETATSVAALAQTDDPRAIEDILKTWSSGKMWRTEVDWDWRINEEVDGKIKNLPLLQKWLQRVRGPVLTKQPVGTDSRQ